MACWSCDLGKAECRKCPKSQGLFFLPEKQPREFCTIIEIVPARLQADCSHVALLLSYTDPLDLPWLKDAAQVATSVLPNFRRILLRIDCRPPMAIFSDAGPE